MVTPINLPRMTNEVHVQFHESVLTLLERISLDTLGLLPFGSMYKEALGNEREALLIVRKSEFTVLNAIIKRFKDILAQQFGRRTANK